MQKFKNVKDVECDPLSAAQRSWFFTASGARGGGEEA
jgi:hypothetical protein